MRVQLCSGYSPLSVVGFGILVPRATYRRRDLSVDTYIYIGENADGTFKIPSCSFTWRNEYKLIKMKLYTIIIEPMRKWFYDKNLSPTESRGALIFHRCFYRHLKRMLSYRVGVKKKELCPIYKNGYRIELREILRKPKTSAQRGILHASRKRAVGSRCKRVFERRNFPQLPLNFSIKRIRGTKNFR